MLSGPSFRSAFVLSINLLIFYSFPLTSFNFAEPCYLFFLWLHTVKCAAVQIYHEILFIYNYSHFWK